MIWLWKEVTLWFLAYGKNVYILDVFVTGIVILGLILLVIFTFIIMKREMNKGGN